MDDALKIGSYAIPWILSILLAFIYSQMTLTDKRKNLVAVICGVLLGCFAIWTSKETWSASNIAEHALYGFNAGLTAVGFWKTLNIQLDRGVTPPTK
jgi:hypothetical protein